MRRIAHYFGPLLFFAIGVAAGAWFSIERRSAAFAAGIERHIAAAPVTREPVPAAGTRAFPSDDEMLTAIMSAVAENEPLLRGHRLHELLGRLGSAELGALFARALQIDDRARRDELLGTLLTRWAAVDRAAADAATRPARDRGHRAGRWDWSSPDSSVSLAWARALPEAALAEAMASPRAPWAGQIANAGLQALAEGDPARQVEVLVRLPPSRLRDQMSRQVIDALADKDPAAAEAALSLLPDERQRTEMQTTILGKIAESDPQAGLVRLAALAPDLPPGQAGRRLVSTILQAVAHKDAAAALGAIDGLPEELQEQARDSVLLSWAGGHSTEALDWAVAHGLDVSEVKATIYYSESQFGVNSLISAALGHDRDQTLAWLRAQPASPDRDVMLLDGIYQGTVAQKLEFYEALTPASRTGVVSAIVSSLYNEDRERARAWVQDLPAGDTRSVAVENMMYSETRIAPNDLETMVNGWAAGPDRDAALRGIVGGLSGTQPTRALDYARRIGNSTARESSIYSIVTPWLNTDPAAARVWLAGTTDLTAESKRVLLRQFQER